MIHKEEQLQQADPDQLAPDLEHTEPAEHGAQDIVMLREEVPAYPSVPAKPSVPEQSLRQTLKHLKSSINQRRQHITNKRTQLKDLSGKVEQQLQKTLLAKPRHAPTNLSDYFSKQSEATGQQFSTQQIYVEELKAELRKVRAEADKCKKQLDRLRGEREQKLIGVPLDRINDIKNIEKNKNDEIERLQAEKEMIAKELAMLEVQVGRLHLDQSEEVLQKHITVKNKTASDVKAERLKLNQIQREDRYCMQKIKFLFEITSQQRFQSKRKSNNSMQKSDRTRFGRDMSELAQEISRRMQQKFHTQSQQKRQLQTLISQTQRLQKQNWNMVARLREYDAFLLNHYNTIKGQKRKKRQSRDGTRDIIEQINSKTVLKEEEEDVIKEEEEVVVEKTEQDRTLELGVMDPTAGVRVADAIDGGLLDALTVFELDGVLWGVQAEYATSRGKEFGFQILAVPKNKEIQTHNFSITEPIEEIAIGHFPNSSKIGYLSLKCNNTHIEWGTAQNMKLQKQKIPNSYTQINLAGCLRQNQDAKTPNEWHLSGLSLQLTVIVEKIKKKIRSVRTRKVKRPQPQSTPKLY